ncbi:MAG: DUF547 domain-containing protein [Desulfarculaceae bacterium]|jgi:hypothetical protein
MIKKPFFLFVTLILGAAWLTLVASAQTGGPIDYGLYAELLKKHVTSTGVDYQGFKDQEAKLDAFLGAMKKIEIDKLPRRDQFAFYINLYNAWTIKLILSRYPDLKSIKDLGGLFFSPWSKKIVRLRGKIITLDNLEHDILRPQFKDPRVHFAINCASKSCPPLLAEPYQGQTLDRQLDKVTRAFINDPKSNYPKGNELYVSRIFRWFAEDFSDDVIGFFLKYAQGDLKAKLDQNRQDIEIKYLDYDWSLNRK